MDTIFMNSENSKTCIVILIVILKLTDKIHLRRGEKSIPLSKYLIYIEKHKNHIQQ